MTKKELEKHQEQIKKDTDHIAENYSGKIIIANFYQLMRDSNKVFDPTYKKPLQTKQPVEADYAVSVNDQWMNSGKLYEVDEDATEKFHEDLESHKQRLTEKDEIEKAAGQALTGALESVKANSGVKPKKEKDKEKDEANSGVKHTHAVKDDLSVIPLTKKMKEKMKPEDFSFVGTEEECNAFVEEHKPE